MTDGAAPVADAAEEEVVRPSRAELARAQRARSAELRIRHGIGSRRRAERLMRGMDIVLVLVLAPLALALIGASAVAIKIDTRGPVFFRQKRTGMNGRRFTIWKLRTMVVDAEAQKSSLMGRTMAQGAAFKLSDDPRVTRVGRVLRKLNLDELPQLWNVLRGDMGIVGPRPTSAPSTTYDLWQTARLSTRPGLTGAWQVTPRKNEMPFDECVRVDIRYQRNRSLAGDVRLIVRTATHAVVRRQGM